MAIHNKTKKQLICELHELQQAHNSLKATIETDLQTEFKHANSILNDLSESERATEELKKSKKQHRTILQTAMDGFWIVDLSGKILEVNDAYCKMSGYSEVELLKMNVNEIEIIEDKTEIEKHINIVKEFGADRFETQHKRKDGSLFIVEITVKTYDTDKLVGFLRDITKQKAATNALLEAEWKFNALFELGPIGVAYHKMIYDETGKPYDYYFIDANERYNELTGVSPKGMTVRQAFPGIENDPFDWIGMFGHVAKTGETIRFEQFLETNGRWYDCVGYQYKPDHFVAAFNEITKRKEIELALKESELHFKVLFDDAPDAMLLADPESRKIVDTNNAACKLFKKQKHELIGLYQYELHPSNSIDYSKNTFKTEFEKTLLTGKNNPIENKIHSVKVKRK